MPGRSTRKTSRSESSLARPIRCSTVTPGKLATFCRNPVSRLNKVDFPEFGGPTMATICRRAWICGSVIVAAGQPWQSPISIPSTKNQPHGGFAAQGHFGAVDAKHPGIAAGCGMRRCDRVPGQKAQFHQSPGVIFRKVEPVENTGFSAFQVAYVSGRAVVWRSLLLETHLQLESDCLGSGHLSQDPG